MKLQNLFKDLDVKIHGSPSTEINDLTLHSKLVKPKDLFIAVKGYSEDGSKYIEEAIQSGASCILTDLYNPFLKVAQLIAKNPKSLVSSIAKKFYKDPSSKLFLIGITGTNGKTTTSYLVKHLLDEKNYPCALLGTIEYIIKDHIIPASLTTPDSITLNKLLRDMVKNSCEACVMEVSSHALDQSRANDLSFDVGVFTNLSEEHLDYHENMIEYAKAKAKLFTMVKKASVLNADDLFFTLMKQSSKVPVYTFGIENQADLTARNIECHPSGMHFLAEYKNETIAIQTNLLGTFNVYNILAAMLVGIIKGISLKTMAEKLKTAPRVLGRLEKVSIKKDIHVYVDFAHKEKALEEVLKTLKSFSKGRIITVFGCGGDRDTLKRPKMGSVATKYSDFVILTNDNPRSEDPLRIIADIQKGMEISSQYEVILDRKQAIERAIAVAEKNDIVLIAGKGHEKVQKFKDKSIPFSDREIALGC